MNNATMAQLVEHILGKDEVIGSIPISSSKNPAHQCGIFTSSLKRDVVGAIPYKSGEQVHPYIVFDIPFMVGV